MWWDSDGITDFPSPAVALERNSRACAYDFASGSDVNEIVGVLAAGAVGVAAGAGVNVVPTKVTKAFIGAGAHVTADGNSAGPTVDTGQLQISPTGANSVLHPDSPSGVGIQTENSSTMTDAANGDHADLASQGQVGSPDMGPMDLTGGGTNQSLNNQSLTGDHTTSVATQSGFHGVAVTATNQDETRTFTVTFGAGAVGVAVSAGVDVVSADTEAYIGANARVNTDPDSPNATQSVLVASSNDFYHLSVGIGVGVGSVGVAPSVGVNVIKNTTIAAIDGSAVVHAAGDVAVEASGTENVVLIGMGVAAGAVGVGAVVDVLSISNTTTASIGASATVLAGGTVFVNATDSTQVFELSGALAGGFVGVGGAVGVMLISKSTDAEIGSFASVEGLGKDAGSGVGGVLVGTITGGAFDTTNSHGVIVQAQSSEDITHIVAAGGVGFVGVSGAVGVALLQSSTSASIDGSAQIDQNNPGGASGAQSVYVNASNDISVSGYVIGVAGGFVGVTGAVYVGTLTNNTTAEIDGNAVVGAAGNVEVNAVGLQSLTNYVISGAGGFVGAGASVDVWSIGTQLQMDYSDDSGNSSSAVANGSGDPNQNAAQQSQAGTGFITGSQGIGSLQTGGANSNSSAGRVNSATSQASTGVNSAAPTQSSIMAMEASAPAAPGTSAVIHAGAIIKAGHSIGVTATEQATINQYLGQVAVGVVGAGGAVDILSVNDNVQASDDGDNTAGGNVTVAATLTSHTNIMSLDLAGGFVGLGVGVIVVTDDSVTQATLGTVHKAQDVSVEATSNRTITTFSGQASIGAVGAGATFTRVNIGGWTSATIDAFAVLGDVSKLGSLTVESSQTVTVNAQTYAVSAGIGATSLNFTFVNDTSKVTAQVGDNVTITTAGEIKVESDETMDEQGKTFGVSAGGLAVGASLTQLTVSPTVTASIGTLSGGSDTISAGSIDVAAITHVPADGYDVQANATGSAGALVGITSTNTVVKDSTQLSSFIAGATQLAVAGAVTITALNNTRQRATSDSNAGGLIAVGLAYSDVESHTTTDAHLGDGGTVFASDLTVSATGGDDNFAYTNAGSGGLVAGASSEADTATDSTVIASAGGQVYLTDTYSVAAVHTATFNAQITTLAGGLLAGAGASMTNEMTSHVTATTNANAHIQAFDISVTANNNIDKPTLGGGTPENIKGTTGGLVSGAASDENNNLTVTTDVVVGNNAFMKVLGAPSDNPVFQLRTDNDFELYDTTAFETGGVLSGAGANGTINVITDTSHVTVGQNTTLWSQGALVMTARGQGTIKEDLEADTFGLGTVSAGTAQVNINPDNQIHIEAGSVITAYGDLDVGVGTDSAADYDHYTIEARFDAYAGSLVPLSDVNANAYLNQFNTITIDGGAHLMTAMQANLDAQQLPIADMTAFAQAVSWASDLANAILTALGGGGAQVHGGNNASQTYSNIYNDGTVETGITRNIDVEINPNPSFNPADPSSVPLNVTVTVEGTVDPNAISYSIGTQDETSSLATELAYDESQLANYGSTNPTLKTFYTSEIARITAELVSSGQAIKEPISGQPFPQFYTLVPTSLPVLEITIDPITADPGKIDVRTDRLLGNGTFIAPNDASVTIGNHSPAFLNLEGINIPADAGGLYFDGGLITGGDGEIVQFDNDNVNRDNSLYEYKPPVAGVSAGDVTFGLNIAGGPSAAEPIINVTNDYDVNVWNLDPAHTQSQLQWPDIDVVAGGQGIFNLAGTVELTIIGSGGSGGNININAPLQAKHIDINTPGAVSITGVSQFATGSTPYTMFDTATYGSYAVVNGQTQYASGVASADVVEGGASGVTNFVNNLQPGGPTVSGSRVTINADYIDLNGEIQSGQDTYNLTLGAQANTDIQDLINAGATGLQKLANESNSYFDVFFDMSSHQIVIADLTVNGGYVNLTGHIMDTGNGIIKVLGGYGTINITNNTNWDIAIHRLDDSTPGQGTLLINDLAKNAVSQSTATIYQDNPGSGTITVTTDPGSGPTVNNVTGASSVYDPASGWRYGWTVGVSFQRILTDKVVNTNWLNLIPTGSDFFSNATTVPVGTPTLVGAGPYYYYNANPANIDYNFAASTITTSDSGIQTISHTEISTWYGGHTYSATLQDVQGTETFFNHDINASRPVQVDFTGGATGTINVTSTGSGNVYIDSAVLNPTGTTTIDAEHGSVIQGSAAELISGQSVVLTAADNIGSKIAPVVIESNAEASTSAAAGYFTAGNGSTAGTFTRTDGGNWITQGFAAGQSIQVVGSTFNVSTYTLSAVSASKLTFLTTDPIATEGTAGSPESLTFTRTGGAVTSGGLTATVTSGDIYINQAQGDLALVSVTSQSQGTVNLVSQGGIIVAPGGIGQTQVSAGIINLTASGGGIGNSTTQPLLIDTPNPVGGLTDTFTGNAQANVYLQEKTGDLRLFSLTAGGDVWIDVPNGSLLNANTNTTTDARTEAQLAAGVWSDLGLTGAGYTQKISDTLSSFVSQKDSDYETYWTYRHMQPDDGATYNSSFVVNLTPAEYTYYTTVLGYDAAAITTLVNARTAEYHVLNATYGDGGTYQAQDPGFQPDVYQGTATLITAPAYFSGNTGAATAYFTSNDTAAQAYITGNSVNPPVYFTASIGAGNTTPGTITRTDGGSWISDGFVVGDTVQVTGSLNDSGTFVVSAMTAGVLTLSAGEAVLGEATAAFPENVTVTRDASATITRTDGGSWTTDGFAVGQAIVVGGSARDSNGSGLIYTIQSVSSNVITLAAGTPLRTEASAAAPETLTVTRAAPAYIVGNTTTTNAYFTAGTVSAPGTITRTDGGSWINDGFQIGETVQVTSGSAANTGTYTITAVTKGVLTLSLADTITSEASAGAAERITIQNSGAATINRTDGGSYISDGFSTGESVVLNGSATAVTIASVTASTITLQSAYSVAGLGSAASPQPIAINANAIVRTDGGSWVAEGFQAGQTISVAGSAANSTAPGQNFTIVAVTASTVTLSASSAIHNEASFGSPEPITVTSNQQPTITRTDGGNWINDGFVIGQSITVAGSTLNSTGVGQTYQIANVTAGAITLQASDAIQTEASAGTPESVSLRHTTTNAAVQMTAYFTAGSPGTITRTDTNGNWLADGFAVGQTVLVTGSAHNDTTGGASYTVTAVTATKLTLSNGDALTSEGSAGSPVSITVQHKFSYKVSANEQSTLVNSIKDWTPDELLTLYGAGLLKNVTSTVVTTTDPNIVAANVTLLTGQAVGQVADVINIDLSHGPVTLTQDQRVALAAAERTDVQYLGAAPITAAVNFGVNTITRTDGTWAGLSVGELITVQAVSGQTTQNATNSTVFYKIVGIDGSDTILTIDPSTPMTPEGGKSITVAPIVQDPSFQATGSQQSVMGYFNANTAASGGMFTRTDGGNFLSDGYAPGQLLLIGGSLNNTTAADIPDVIVSVTATTITLALNDVVFNEASSLAPETVQLTRGIAPIVNSIQITQSNALNVIASGKVNATAGLNVYLDFIDPNNAAATLQLGLITAGTTSTAFDIRIKGGGGILDKLGAGATNLVGGNIILESANGSIGVLNTPVVLSTVGTGTVTARANGIVDLFESTDGGLLSGNMNLESVFSQTANAVLTAVGSILNPLNNGFTTVEAMNIVLDAQTGTIGNLVGGGPQINFLNVDATHIGAGGQDGTVTADALGSIYIYETTLNLNTDHVDSVNGDVVLKAALSILSAADPASPVIDVYGNNITLDALTGGIGLAGNQFFIDSHQNGTGVLTASSNVANIYIVQEVSDLYLNTVGTAPGYSAFLTAPFGSIINALVAPAVYNVTSGNTFLFARNNIGSSGDRITTQVGVLEGQSTLGSTWVDNSGALSVGGAFTADPLGILAGGSVSVTASSPVTIAKNVKSTDGGILIIALEPAGENEATETVSDDLIVDAVDSTPSDIIGATVNFAAAGNTITRTDGGNWASLSIGQTIAVSGSAHNNTPANVYYLITGINGGILTISSATPLTNETGAVIAVEHTITISATGGGIRLLAGDNLTVQNGASIQSDTSVELAVGYQGDNTGASDPFDTGSTPGVTGAPGEPSVLTVAGKLVAPEILIHGGTGNDIIQVTNGTLTATSQIVIRGESGTNQVLLWGTVNAPDIEVYGDGTNDLLALNPDNDKGYLLSIAGQVDMWGGTSDTLLVNKLNTLDYAHKFLTGATGVTSVDTGHSQALHFTSVRDTVNLWGGNGTNNEIVNLTGTNDYIVNVHRNGAEGNGTDTLTIDGVAGTDTFLLRQDFVALLQGTQAAGFAQTYERVNYDTSINVLNVNGLEPVGYVYNDATEMVQAQPPNAALDGSSLALSLASHTNFYVDDNSAITTLTGADGGDTFQFGQMYGEARTGGISVQFGDDVSTVQTTAGYLSRGISFATTAYGGAGDDTFDVYSNQAPLKLYGEAGNDTFVVRAFIIVNTNTVATDDTTIHTGSGTSHIEYNINAPVSIDGGDGVNTVVVIGSGNGDNFVITRDGVEGAGLNVSMTNVQILEVDGIAGNNNFYVLSTAPSEVVTLIGGSGNDTFNVAGDVTTPIIAENTSGISGFINHSVSSLDPAYNGIFVNGVPVDVATGQTGTVIVSQPTLQVFKDPTLGPNVSTYTVSLAAPAATVAAGTIAYLTVAASLRPFNLSAQGAKSIEVSTDGIHFSQSLVLTFNQATNWNAPQKIYVRADQDSVVEGEQTIIVSHSIESSNPLFNELPISNVEVDVVDNNAPDVIITQSHPGNLNVVEGTAQDPSNPFPGQTDSYTVELTRAPAADETVTVTLNSDVYSTVNHLLLSSSDSRFTNATATQPATITFNASNWNKPVTVIVASYDGPTLEDPREADIIHTVTSSDPADALFNNVSTQHKVRVIVTDSELAQVLVTPGSDPMIVSATQTATYTLELTTKPTAPVVISLLSDGKTVLSVAPVDTPAQVAQFTPASGAKPPTVTFNSTNWDTPFTVQVSVNPDFTLNPTVNFSTAANTITLTSPGSWLVDGLAAGQMISVEAANGQTTQNGTGPTAFYLIKSVTATVITLDPSTPLVANETGKQVYVQNIQPVQVFPAQPHLLSSIQGPLIIEGDKIPNKDRSIRPAIMLPTEVDVSLPVILHPDNPATQTNTLNVFNDGSTQNDIGTLGTLNANDISGIAEEYLQTPASINPAEFGDITGDNLGGELTLNFGTLQHPVNDTFPGGITYRNVQVTNVMLGSGNDTFTVNATPVQPLSSFGADVGDSITVIQGGGGNNDLIANGGGAVDKNGNVISALVLAGSTTQNGLFYNSTTQNLTGNARAFSDPGNNTLDAHSDPNPVVLYGGPGNDIIRGGAGGDWIAGGSGANVIYGGTGNDDIYGADGFNLNLSLRLSLAVAANQQVLSVVNAPGPNDYSATHDALNAGNNTIYGSSGSGNDIIIGDHGIITQTAGTNRIQTTGNVIGISTTLDGNYGNSIIYGGGGNDVIFGGSGQNHITGGHGSDIIFGADGRVVYSTPGVLSLIQSIDAQFGGGNVIKGSVGNDIIIGGSGNDNITGGSSNDVIIGDNGEIDYYAAGTIQTIKSIIPASGGSNIITGGKGDDIIIGGIGNNTIYGGGGNNVILGEDGMLSYTALGGALSALGGNLSVIESIDFNYGGSDYIYGGTLNNIIIAGTGDSNLWGGPHTGNLVNDLLIGANAFLMMDGTGLGYAHATYITTMFTDPDNPGLSANTTKDPGRTVAGTPNVNDVIQGYGPSQATGPTPAGGSDNILIGGPGNTWIGGGTGDDLIFGNNVTISRVSTITDPRFEALAGTQIYTDTATTDTVNVTGTPLNFRSESGYMPAWDNWKIVNLDESDTTTAANYGNNYIAGGAGDNMIFGGQGNNVVQGAGSILGALNPPAVAVTQSATGSVGEIVTLTLTLFTTTYSLALAGQNIDGIAANVSAGWLQTAISSLSGFSGKVTVSGGAGGPYTISFDKSLGNVMSQASVNSKVYAYRDPTINLTVAPGQVVTALGALHVNPSFESVTDGNNYIEGGGGNSAIFGGIGQNDIIGGNSDMFSLATPSQRPDSGNAIIFAGAGTEIARDLYMLPAGTTAGNAHARNASVVVANNGDIYDLVGTNAKDSGGFLTYNYDSGQNGFIYMPGEDVSAKPALNYYGGTQFVIPRAVKLLDYTYGGPDFNAAAAASDRGAPAEIHAESGDTEVYGGPNLDYLFGGSGNDLIVGGYGGKWISGGNGETGQVDSSGNPIINTTGILGSDGRLAMSRDTSAYGEPLYGIAAIPASQINEVISTPGNTQMSTINVLNSLLVTAEMTPFNPDPSGILAWQTTVLNGTPYQPQHYDDVIYGGLGNTFIHGGPGSSAISGSQALPVFWNDPVQNPYNYSTTQPGGGILGFNAATSLFAAYSEANPRVEIGGALTGFFLNFDPALGVSVAGTTAPFDGTKNIFGDNGNDWIVGGNGSNNLFGGFGDDLLDGRRNLTLDGGLNDIPDNNPVFHSVVFGGSGPNTLIAGGAYDRLIDWAGNFNTYIVPFAPWGQPTVSRQVSPHIMTYLYELGAAEGADNLYADYNAPGIDNVPGLDPTRDGEPFGELGLVNQHDPFWKLQTGAPNQQPPGNLGGVSRQVTGKFTAATSSTTNLAPIAPSSGTWTMSNSLLNVTPTTSGASTLAFFDDTDYLPSYYEMTSSVTLSKPGSSGQSNGYLIFDYVSATDFKFAGVNLATGTIQIGQFNGTSWVIDASVAERISAGTSYGLALAINGTTATLTVNGNWTVSYTFAPRMVDGTAVGLNYGTDAIGSNGSTAAFGDTGVQVLVLPYTANYQQTFNTAAPKYFDTPAAGTWTVNGADTGVAAANGVAISTVDLGLALGMKAGTYTPQASSTIEITTTMKQIWPRAGIVFDMHGTGNFNFAAMYDDTQQVVVGHYTLAGGWVIDASVGYGFNSGKSYTLDLLMNGGLVNVSVNGTLLLTYNYGTIVTGGQFGLISINGTNYFQSIQVQTNDPAFSYTASGGATLLQVASDPPPTNSAGSPLTPEELAPIVTEADLLWISALGPNDARLSALTTVDIQIATLPGLELGQTHDGIITISPDAAGWGWFVDPTPGNNSEFPTAISDGALLASASGPASGHMDLLSTVLHEMGNAMGFAEDTGQDVTGMVLQPGERRLPTVETGPPAPPIAMPGLFARAADPGNGASTPILGSPVVNWGSQPVPTGGAPMDTPAFAPMPAFGTDAATPVPGLPTVNARTAPGLPGRRPVEIPVSDPPPWLIGFLNDLGQGDGTGNPNAGLKLKVPGAIGISRR